MALVGCGKKTFATPQICESFAGGIAVHAEARPRGLVCPVSLSCVRTGYVSHVFWHSFTLMLYSSSVLLVQNSMKSTMPVNSEAHLVERTSAQPTRVEIRPECCRQSTRDGSEWSDVAILTRYEHADEFGGSSLDRI